MTKNDVTLYKIKNYGNNKKCKQKLQKLGKMDKKQHKYIEDKEI